MVKNRRTPLENPTQLHMALVEALKLEMHWQQMSQTRLSLETGVSRDTINRILLGVNPGKLETWGKILEVLDVEAHVRLAPGKSAFRKRMQTAREGK